MYIQHNADRASAGTLLTKCRPHIHTGSAMLQGRQFKCYNLIVCYPYKCTNIYSLWVNWYPTWEKELMKLPTVNCLAKAALKCRDFVQVRVYKYTNNRNQGAKRHATQQNDGEISINAMLPLRADFIDCNKIFSMSCRDSVHFCKVMFWQVHQNRYSPLTMCDDVCIYVCG